MSLGEFARPSPLALGCTLVIALGGLTGCGSSTVVGQAHPNASASSSDDGAEAGSAGADEQPVSLAAPASFTCPDLGPQLSAALDRPMEAMPPSSGFVCEFRATGISAVLMVTTLGDLTADEARASTMKNSGATAQIVDHPQLSPGAFSSLADDLTQADLLVPYASGAGLWLFRLQPATQFADPVGTLLTAAHVADQTW